MTGDRLIRIVEAIMRARGIDIRDDDAFNAIQAGILDGGTL